MQNFGRYLINRQAAIYDCSYLDKFLGIIAGEAARGQSRSPACVLPHS